MTMIDLALILLYTCALVIKGCEWSPEGCAEFGFGDSAKGECGVSSYAPILQLLEFSPHHAQVLSCSSSSSGYPYF